MLALMNHYFGWSETFKSPEKMEHIRSLAEKSPVKSFFLYSVFTIVGCVLLALPGVTFAIVAGTVFGPVRGTLACLAATTLGAVIAFLAGRFFLQDSVKPMLEKNKTLKRLLLEGDEKNQALVLMITRMVPLFPYNLQNFAYGITDISLFTYTLYTFIFMAPGVALFTLGTSGILDPENRVRFLLGAGGLAVLTTLAGLFIKKKYITEIEEVQEDE